MKDINKLEIGILEFGNRENTDSLSAIQQILDYAIEADNLSFSRFWLGEHHDAPDKTAPYLNPDLLLTVIAGMTEQIRIGSAGTLLNLYNSYTVVSNYKLLNNLFSNRVDLGLSRNIPYNLEKYFRNITNKDFDSFDKKLEEIYNLINKENDNYEIDQILIPPYGGNNPEVWCLSSSYSKFNDAIKYKFNYCRSIFHYSTTDKMNYEKEELIAFKTKFFNENNFYPKITLAVAISIGKTIENAKKNYLKALKKEGVELSKAMNVIIVTIDSLYELLHEYQHLFGIDEFILYDTEENNLKKIKNLKDISQKFKLEKTIENEN